MVCREYARGASPYFTWFSFWKRIPRRESSTAPLRWQKIRRIEWKYSIRGNRTRFTFKKVRNWFPTMQQPRAFGGKKSRLGWKTRVESTVYPWSGTIGFIYFWFIKKKKDLGGSRFQNENVIISAITSMDHVFPRWRF